MGPHGGEGGHHRRQALVVAAAAALVALSVQVAIAGQGTGPEARTAVSSKQFKKLKKRVAALEGRQPAQVAAAGEPIPAGTVAFFNLSSCPTGWSEVTAARGRYLVGLPPAGALGATTGTALTNQQNRAVGQHTHGVTDPGHSHSSSIPIGSDDVTVGSANALDVAGTDSGPFTVPTGSETTGLTVNSAGAIAGTNAPYIQLLVCQKS